LPDPTTPAATFSDKIVVNSPKVLRSQSGTKTDINLVRHNYLLSQWAPLIAHLHHGESRLDNNLVENAIRPSCIGKKNWLFIGHPDAGQRSAILYSLIVSCQRHGKDPMAYMKDLLTRLPRMTNRDDLRALTPRLWQPATS